MSRINTIHNKVKRILENKPETRADDWLLILEVWKDFVDTDVPVVTLLTHHIELGVPNFESIRRCRQKIQEENPHLVDEEAKAIRKKEEAKYRKYALNKLYRLKSSLCVCCGKEVPEGRQVCPNCEKEVE
jgi:hypothetical protein